MTYTNIFAGITGAMILAAGIGFASYAVTEATVDGLQLIAMMAR